MLWNRGVLENIRNPEILLVRRQNFLHIFVFILTYISIIMEI
jgi:hypothetical protein